MFTPSISAIALTCTFGLAGEATAQEPMPDVPRTIWDLAARSNWYVRVVYADHDTIAGRVRIVQDEPRIHDAAVPVHPVLSIERRDKSIGPRLFKGTVLGVAASMLVVSVLDEYGVCVRACLHWVPVVGTGSLVGFGVSYLTAPDPRWQPVWPNDPD